jgi:transmembrane protein TMEM220
MAHVVWIGANIFMLLLFVLSVAVQYNDPDPVRWMTIYGLAAVVCGLTLAGHAPPWWLTVPVGVVALAWAATIAPRVLGKVPFLEMFSAWEMKNIGIEELREMYGLVIVAGWMAVVTAANWR